MGNTLGRKKTTKVMKINGETFELKTPVKAEVVVKDYPGHVLLDSEAVKHYGVRAKPLQPHHNLEPKRLYFVVELPNPPKECPPRRVRSAIQMNAQERLESLMLARRSVSDLSIMNLHKEAVEESSSGGGVRLKLRVPKAELEKVVKESENEAEATEKILSMCVGKPGNIPRGIKRGDEDGRARQGFKARQKRVSFMAVKDAGQEIAVAS